MGLGCSAPKVKVLVAAKDRPRLSRLVEGAENLEVGRERERGGCSVLFGWFPVKFVKEPHPTPYTLRHKPYRP